MKKTLITLMALSGVAFGATSADVVNSNLAQAIEDYGYNKDYGFTMTAVIETAYAGRVVTFNDTETWYLYSQEKKYFGISTNGDGGTWDKGTVNGDTTYSGILKEGERSWLVGPVSTSTVKLIVACAGVVAGESETPQYTTSITLLDANENALISATIMDENGSSTKYLDYSKFKFNTPVTSALIGIYAQDGTQIGDIDLVDYVSPPPVPEPATATLSLLALAGLAARRRRR